jgi:hypothetical protein
MEALLRKFEPEIAFQQYRRKADLAPYPDCDALRWRYSPPQGEVRSPSQRNFVSLGLSPVILLD